jgi:hypothetical protein
MNPELIPHSNLSELFQQYFGAHPWTEGAGEFEATIEQGEEVGCD